MFPAGSDLTFFLLQSLVRKWIFPVLFCGGTGCRVCKYSGGWKWVERGMVDPNVFDILGIDSEVYTGYAFGLGIEKNSDVEIQYSGYAYFMKTI